MDKFTQEITELADTFRSHYGITQKLGFYEMFQLATFGSLNGSEPIKYSSVKEALSNISSGLTKGSGKKLTIAEMIQFLNTPPITTTLLDETGLAKFGGKTFDLKIPDHTGKKVSLKITVTVTQSRSSRSWTVSLPSLNVSATTGPLPWGFITATVQLDVPANDSSSSLQLVVGGSRNDALRSIKVVAQVG